MLNKLKNIYGKSPSFLKNIYGFIPNDIKYGKVYRYWKKINKNNDNLLRSPNETLKYAIKNFIFYKELYENINVNDWHNIPLLNKETIQKHLSEFELKKIKKLYVTTGGVTGKPAKFYQSNNVWYKEMAYVYSYFESHGYESPNLKASFRGADFSNLKVDEYWKSNPHHYEINFSPFHINAFTVEKYVKKLNEIKPKFFHGYPSALLSLAKFMEMSGLNLNYSPTCFFLISEGYTTNQIKFLESFFNCKMNSFYGQSERVVFAKAFDNLENYQADQNYGYFELVDLEGNVIEENNKVGEIVATSYDNYAMPLIRYKTGDFTSYSNYQNKTFKKISGKWGQLFLYGSEKEEISLTALNLHSTELNDIIKIQFIQVDYGIVNVNVSFSCEIYDGVLASIETLLSKRVGNKIMFNFLVSNDFKFNKRGKTPLIINLIKKGQ
jgi:phenylacetate-CoA ligase